VSNAALNPPAKNVGKAPATWRSSAYHCGPHLGGCRAATGDQQRRGPTADERTGRSRI